MAQVDATRISVSNEAGEDLPKCTLKFQCGLLRETETFLGDDVRYLCTDSVLEYVNDMLYFKYPDHPYGDLYNKLLLFRHDEITDDLIPLKDDDDIVDGMIIEIILAANSTQEKSNEICSHLLRVHTYKAPTFCDHCGVVMIGLLKQGLKCEGCDKNFHKKCAYKIPNDCTRYWAETGLSPPTPGGGATWSGRPLWIDKAINSRPQVPHTFFIHSFKKPTACQKCKKMIKGVYKNGMKCKDCGNNYHKKCAKDVGKNCPGEVPSLSKIDNGEYTNTRVVKSNDTIASERLLVSGNSNTPLTLALDPVPVNGGPHEPKDDNAGVNGVAEEQKEVTGGNNELGDSGSIGSSQEEEETMVDLPQSMDTIAEEPSGGEDSTSNDGSEHNLAESTPSGNITLQRVTGVSMRNTKQPPATVLMEGWMIHYTNKSNLRKKHYWRLDTKCLTLYKSNDSDHYYREIQLADILAVDPMINGNLYPLSPPHVFEIVTSSCTYYVGVDMTGASPDELATPSTDLEIAGSNILGDVSKFSIVELEDMGIGLNTALLWEESLHNALMPVTPQASMGSLAEIGGQASIIGRPHSFRGKRGSFQGSFRGSSFRGNRANSFRGSSIRGHRGSTKGSFRGSFKAMKQNNPPAIPARQSPQFKPIIETKLDVALFYQIFPEEILGSGQFGTVYGGQNRTSGKHVAVKVIDKLRFPHKQDSALRQEVTILQTLAHPGIIKLEQMFETPEKIHIVMEKMNGDMLEMILSSPNSRLSERVTKYLIYQILAALQYLHKKDVVHCDLKPENVLLTSESGMPLAKLCDFGFARIIGEKSFRKSIVGTPAYLAPEVLKNEGYNRSLDLWSVGVIVYVSLSGTFPFNEDEEIGDQIHNAAFMYPPDPWASISREAIDLVSRLLQLSRRTRFKTNQALNHVWLNDIHLWEDLCALEGQLGIRYLTHESEDSWWIKQGAKQHPLAAVQATKYQHHTYNNITILEDPRHGTSPIATTAMIANVQEKVPSTTTATTATTPKDHSKTLQGKDSNSPTPSNTSRKSVVEIENEYVEKLEKHATRVGYTVSTV